MLSIGAHLMTQLESLARHGVSLLFVVALASDTAWSTPELGQLEITPSKGQLLGRDASQRFLVSAEYGTEDNSERRIDLSQECRFSTTTPQVIAVSSDGVVTPVADGVGIVVAQHSGKEAQATVTVSRSETFLPVDFETHVQPILTRFGCNAGACHGKQRGQNGFQLSLLGFDDDFDHRAVVQGTFGRRLLQAFPDRSLFLMKPSAALPHGGGKLLDPTGRDYQTLKRWILLGMPRRGNEAPRLESVSVTPSLRLMRAKETQALLVTAHFSDGTEIDVTRHATYLSSESPVVKVDEHGLLTAGSIPGEATIMTRYQGKIATCNVTIPLIGRTPASFYAALPRNNFIDDHVWRKLGRLGFTPSKPCTDATFLRRVSIDLIGRLPTPEESRAFLVNSAADKRSSLVDELLERPEFADHWANKWVDLLRPNPYRTGMKSVLNLDNWIRESFRRNDTYDTFVHGLITARGSTFRNGATTIFRDRRSPDEITTMVSQLFLGIRLECAKCHKHPFEIWRQQDFYSFAAYFANVGRKGTGLSPPISGGEEFILTRTGGSVLHPRTGQALKPNPLFGEAPVVGDEDPRESLARWMTNGNPFFSQVMANRVWADLMGRGVVEPVDDLRATNPPSNGPLLEALARDFAGSGYDLKKLLKRITMSYVYSLSSTPTKTNVVDTRNYSRHYRQRLRAEVLLDAVTDITGISESFDAVPAEARASQIWTHRSPSLFLDTFGRPDRNQDPPCYRIEDTSVVQALHLMNAPTLHDKVTSDDGRAAELAKGERPTSEIVEELYLLAYSRLPNAKEREVAGKVFSDVTSAAGADPLRARRQATEDLLWALLNTPEFIFKD